MTGFASKPDIGNRTALILRWIMAGPLTLVAAVASMASTPLWWPPGIAGIDNLVFPILLFPAFWAVFFFYALMEPKPWRGVLVLVAVAALNALVIWQQFR